MNIEVGMFNKTVPTLFKDVALVVLLITGTVRTFWSLLSTAVAVADVETFIGIETNAALPLPNVAGFELDGAVLAACGACVNSFCLVSLFIIGTALDTGTHEDLVVALVKFPKRLVAVEVVANEEVVQVLSLDGTAPNENVPGDADFVTVVVTAGLLKFTFDTFKFELVKTGFEAGGKTGRILLVVNVIPDVLVVKSGLEVETFSVFFSETLTIETLEIDETSLSGKVKVTCFGDLVLASFEPRLGTTADVLIGVVFTFVVVVDELRVAHVTGTGTDLTAFTSSA